MIIDIRHSTVYQYDDSTRYSIQALRLTPPTFTGQKVLSWGIVAPGLDPELSFRDAYSNTVNIATLSGVHGDTRIVAAGTIETFDTNGVVKGLAEIAPLRLYLRETPQTEADVAIRELANSTSGKVALDRLHSLMQAVRAAVDYRIGVTHAHTTAKEALAEGQGVCQDHAHVFISAARSLAVPARYVNGYYLAGSGGPSEAHHAWAEAWVDELGWVGFDPANGVCPTDHYVRLATGLDAASAAPIRGTRRGGNHETLDVTVEVQQQGAQQ